MCGHVCSESELTQRTCTCLHTILVRCRLRSARDFCCTPHTHHKEGRTDWPVSGTVFFPGREDAPPHLLVSRPKRKTMLLW